jgi:hypothetical protein
MLTMCLACHSQSLPTLMASQACSILALCTCISFVLLSVLVHVCTCQRMCMRSKAWLAASVLLRLARLPPLQAGCGARVAYAPHLQLRQAFSHMLWSQNSKSLPYIAMLCRTCVLVLFGVIVPNVTAHHPPYTSCARQRQSSSRTHTL